jgi:hypothetical protein
MTKNLHPLIKASSTQAESLLVAGVHTDTIRDFLIWAPDGTTASRPEISEWYVPSVMLNFPVWPSYAVAGTRNQNRQLAAHNTGPHRVVDQGKQRGVCVGGFV